MNGIVYRFARWCPGALGLWLRQKLFPRYFFSCGRGVLFARFITLIAPEKISIGDRVMLNNDVVLDAALGAIESPCIIIGDDVFIGTGTVLASGEKGLITLDAGANFSSLCTVKADARLHIGRNCLIAAYCTLGPATLVQPVSPSSPGTNECINNDITVGDGCWLGVRMSIVEGVTIGNDTIIGAHSFVTRDLPPFSVAVMNPARVMRDRLQK